MERWTEEQSNLWWAQQPWAIGFNYVTSNAVNDVEMWMDATFDLPLIRKELAIAKNLGFNSVRVFLSEIVWKHEGAVLRKTSTAF